MKLLKNMKIFDQRSENVMLYEHRR